MKITRNAAAASRPGPTPNTRQFHRHGPGRQPRHGRCAKPRRDSLGDVFAEDDIVAVIIHLAFYAGWPPAMTALAILKTRAGRRC